MNFIDSEQHTIVVYRSRQLRKPANSRFCHFETIFSEAFLSDLPRNVPRLSQNIARPSLEEIVREIFQKKFFSLALLTCFPGGDSHMKRSEMLVVSLSGGSRGGAQGTHSPLILGERKKRNHRRKKKPAGQAEQPLPPPPPN